MTSLQSSIEAVRRVMHGLHDHAMPYVMSDACPVDELMHALTTMQLVERERQQQSGASPSPAIETSPERP